jgi:heat shock protein HslJ
MKNKNILQVAILFAVFILNLRPVLAQMKKDKHNPWLPKAPGGAKEIDGIYLGAVPCDDCEGILTMIKLTRDNKFVIQTKYQGKSSDIYDDKGKVFWHKDGFTLMLLSETDDSSFIKIADNKLILLDREGKMITGSQASKYILKKEKINITEKYWKLQELNGKPLTAVAGREKDPFILLKAAGNSFSGNGGCNTLLGKYEFGDNNKIAFSGLVTTMMACPDLETEQALRDALESTDHYVISGDILRLEDANKRLTAKFICIYFK